MVFLSAILAVAVAGLAMTAPASAALTRSMIRRGQGTATIALMPSFEDLRSLPSCPDGLPRLTRFDVQVNAGANVAVRSPPSPSSPTPPRPKPQASPQPQRLCA